MSDINHKPDSRSLSTDTSIVTCGELSKHIFTQEHPVLVLDPFGDSPRGKGIIPINRRKSGPCCQQQNTI